MITRLDFTQTLEELGFVVLGAAEDGFDAVELCRARQPDVVLMDLRMPMFDGVSAVECITREKLAKCVLVVTAYSDEETVRRAVACGIAGYLVKPVDKSRLFPAIETALANASREEALRRRAAEAEARLEDMKLVDRAKAQLARETGVTEAEAYRKLQKLAMDKRCPLADIARRILEDRSEYELSQRAKRALMDAYGLSEKEAYKMLLGKAKQEGRSLAEASKAVLCATGLG